MLFLFLVFHSPLLAGMIHVYVLLIWKNWRWLTKQSKWWIWFTCIFILLLSLSLWNHHSLHKITASPCHPLPQNVCDKLLGSLNIFPPTHPMLPDYWMVAYEEFCFIVIDRWELIPNDPLVISQGNVNL